MKFNWDVHEGHELAKGKIGTENLTIFAFRKEKGDTLKITIELPDRDRVLLGFDLEDFIKFAAMVKEASEKRLEE